MSLQRTLFFMIISVASIFIDANPMAHNWPHYTIDEGGVNRKICTCVHMEAIINYFKDKNDLTMVLGAGTQEHDYTERFKNYNFVLSFGDSLEDFKLMTKKLLKSATVDAATEELKEKLKNGQAEPLLIWLNFNEDKFFTFLEKLKGKFKEIIFDYSVTKFINWKPHRVKHIFDALQGNGEFYFDIEPAGGGTAIYFLKPDGAFQIPRPPEYILVLDKFVTYLPPEDLLLPARFKILTGDKTIQAGEYVKQVEDMPPFSVFSVPSYEYVQSYVLGLLKKIGFNAKYMQNAPYPYPNAWGPNPSSNTNFKEYNYILARKPSALEQNLDQLKDSLVQLKTKLESLKDKLVSLKENLEN